MKAFFRKIWSSLSFSFAFIAFMMRLTIRSFGVIDENEED